jgi:hypothetical protein
MAEQIPSVGRIVHFVYGDQHYAAIITAVATVQEGEIVGETWLIVFPPNQAPFTTRAQQDQFGNPSTWHWPEYVPAKYGEIERG